MLLDVSLIHFVVILLSQLKHTLGLADQHVHASTFECVWLCSEGKINDLTSPFVRWNYPAPAGKSVLYIILGSG